MTPLAVVSPIIDLRQLRATDAISRDDRDLGFYRSIHPEYPLLPSSSMALIQAVQNNTSYYFQSVPSRPP
jgi:hypothetical protein